MGTRKSSPGDILEELEEHMGTEEAGGSEGGGEPEGSSAAKVAISGTGRTVADALKKAGLKGQAKDLKGKFAEYLRAPTNKIVCQRISPSKVRGPNQKMFDADITVSLPTPMTLEEVVAHLREEHGGKLWNVRVLDEDSEVLDARNVPVPGEARYVANPGDEFQFADPGMLALGDEQQEQEEEEDPLDREISNKAKEGRILALERQNAELRGKINEAKGENKPKVPEINVEEKIKAALAESEARHRAELAERDKKSEMVEMERRINDSTGRQMGEMKTLIEQLRQGNPQQSGVLSDLKHSIDLLSNSIDSKIEKALGAYERQTNIQITALERGFDGKFASIQQILATIQSRPHDNPMKDIMPLMTATMTRNDAIMTPLLKSLTEKREEEPAPPPNPLGETLETMAKFGMIPGVGNGNMDFGSRVVSFAEKMAPEVLAFIRDEKRQGREVTENAIKNHLKLQAEKISREVSATAAQEIKKMGTQHGLTHKQPPAQPTQQIQPIQPRVANPQPPVKPAAAPPPRPAQAAVSPVGRISADEDAARQRPDTSPIQSQSVASESKPAEIEMSAQVNPATQQVVVATSSRSQKEEVEEEVIDEDGEGDEEDGPELSPEEEMAERVNATLELLEREMKIRPRKIEWPNFAWDNLPGSVLDQIVFSNDEEGIYEAIKPYANPEVADRIWGMIRTNVQSKEFIAAGVNLIKSWYVELQQKNQRAAELVEQQRAQAQGQEQEQPVEGA